MLGMLARNKAWRGVAPEGLFGGECQTGGTMECLRLYVDDANRLNTYLLAKQSTAVLVISSGSILEALIFGKEAVVAGDAGFSNLGFTWDVRDAADLGHALKRIFVDGGRRNNNPGAVGSYARIFHQLGTVARSDHDGLARMILQGGCGRGWLNSD